MTTDCRDDSLVVPEPTKPEPNVWPSDSESWEGFSQRIANEAKAANPRVVFIGDSITQGWSSEGLAEWNTRFKPLPSVNFGMGGDRTQNILWRVQHGAFNGISPDLIVLNIGVNNIWTEVQVCGTEKVAEGIFEVIHSIHKANPMAKILVVAILPTQELPDNPLRAYLSEINQLTQSNLSSLGSQFSFVDIGGCFLNDNGTIKNTVMTDFCHLSAEGYRIYADSIEPIITSLLNMA